MEKKQVLVEYKKAVISAIDLALDAIKNVEDLGNEEIEKSQIRYSELRKKVENDEDLSNADYTFLSMICFNAGHSLSNNAAQTLRAAEGMQNLAKAFMA